MVIGSEASRQGIGTRCSVVASVILFGACSLVTWAFTVRAQATQSLPRSKIIEKVGCQMHPDQSYALYIPSSYNSGSPSPILYCFDALARGGVPVESFKDAAEKYGYIVAGSNNSRNGPNDVIEAAISAIWDDTHSRFSIDEGRIYTAGFSGGARVASAIAFSGVGPKPIAGVIACSGGLPAGAKPSSRSVPIPFFCTAGTEDFNFPEMVLLSRTLDTLNVPNRLEVFRGGHAWAPKERGADAIEWMEIQAFKSGTHAKNESLLEELFNKAVGRAKAFEAGSNVYAAFVAYREIARDFKGLKDVAAYESRAGELRNSKDVKQYLKQEDRQIEEQNSRAREVAVLKARALGGQKEGGLPTLGNGTATSGNDPEGQSAALSDLRKALADLRKKGEAAAVSDTSLVAKRVLGGFLVESYETAMALMRNKQYERAAANLELAAEAQPSSPGLFYDLGCAYSLSKQKSKALKALQKAIEKGFSDRAALETDKDLDAIRDDPGFKKLLEALKNRSD